MTDISANYVSFAFKYQEIALIFLRQMSVFCAIYVDVCRQKEGEKVKLVESDIDTGRQPILLIFTDSMEDFRCKISQTIRVEILFLFLRKTSAVQERTFGTEQKIDHLNLLR